MATPINVTGGNANSNIINQGRLVFFLSHREVLECQF